MCRVSGKGNGMSESTFSERVEEDRITAKYIYHGEQVTYDRDSEGQLKPWRSDHWTIVLFRPDNETWDDGRMVHGAHRLGGPQGEIGHTLVLTYSTGLAHREAKRKHFPAEPVKPDVAEVLSDYCNDAHGIENEVTFENWFSDRRSEPGQEPLLFDYRQWESMCRDRDELKRFLGSKYDEYINHTEWE